MKQYEMKYQRIQVIKVSEIFDYDHKGNPLYEKRAQFRLNGYVIKEDNTFDMCFHQHWNQHKKHYLKSFKWDVLKAIELLNKGMLVETKLTKKIKDALQESP